MSSLRSLRRGIELTRENDVSPGDVIITLQAFGQDGIAAALYHVLRENFPQGFRVLDIIPGPMIPKPEPPGEGEDQAQAGPSKILRPKVEPGVVGAAKPKELVQTFTIVCLGTMPREGRQLPEPDPRNSPNGNPH